MGITPHQTPSERRLTAGEILQDGGLLEVVRDPKSGTLRLFHFQGDKSSVAPEQVLNEHCYVVIEAASRFCHLPAGPKSYGSTADLFKMILEFAIRSLEIPHDAAALITFFTFASYFSEAVAMSPCLLLSGACHTAVSVLRFLSCICRHPILLAGTGVNGFPRELRPTRLICQADRALDKYLASLQFRGFEIISGGPRLINGATAVYIGNAELSTPFQATCLLLAVPSTARTFSTQDEERESATILSLQNQLLAYKLHNFGRVKSSTFDAVEFSGSTRLLARTLGQCVVDAAELRERLIDLLQPIDDAERTEGASQFDAVVVEALVVACHEQKMSIHVGEIAQLSNAILKAQR